MFSFIMKNISAKNVFLLVFLYETLYFYRFSNNMDFIEQVAIDPEQLNMKADPLFTYTSEQEKQLAIHHCMDPTSLDIIKNQFSIISSSLNKLQANFSPNQSKISKILFCDEMPSPLLMVHTGTLFHKHPELGHPILLIYPKIIPYLNDEELTSALAHELAHVVLGHVEHNNGYMLSYYMHHFTSNFNDAMWSSMIMKTLLHLSHQLESSPARSISSIMSQYLYSFANDNAAIFALSYSALTLASSYLQQFELDADKLSVSLSGDNRPMVNFLRKMAIYSDKQKNSIEESTLNPCLVKPSFTEKSARIYSFFATHPDVNHRVEELCSMPSQS